ncbi:hypothetical protein P4B35_22805, partial [Pontiellaceae bacterium B12227]|nr:hypothetical protein [Pontiellaceae bacterium B12227]
HLPYRRRPACFFGHGKQAGCLFCFYRCSPRMNFRNPLAPESLTRHYGFLAWVLEYKGQAMLPENSADNRMSGRVADQ